MNDLSRYSLRPQTWRLFLNFGLLSFVTIALSGQIDHPSLYELLLFPFMLLVGNGVVYLLHRFPLHRTYSWSKYAYRKHTIEHHSYFKFDRYQILSLRDIPHILFPPEVILIFVLLIIPVTFILVNYICNTNIAFITTAMMSFYFLAYEIMHTFSHLPEDAWPIKYFRFFRYMRKFHRIHHHPTFMRKANFGIVLPFMDYLFGTFVKEIPIDKN